jgi:structural maintenance of chromosome 3 (chondroitin sulfate proteoglycan 6)
LEKGSITEQLDEVTQLIAQSEAELERIEPLHEERRSGLVAAQEELARVESRVEALYGKQGRGRQFTSKSERDAFLQVQIDSLTAVIAGKQTLLGRTRSEVLAEELRVQREKEFLAKAEDENRIKGVRSEELTQILRERTVHRNELQEQRKTCWRQLDVFQEQLQEAKQELERGKQQLNSSLPRSITQGLATVERVAEEKGLTGYYGPLIDNIKLKSDAYRVAVEVAAGNSLFHVIVDTDTTAAYLMKELERRKAGRLTFLPLNRLRNPDVQYPDSNDVHSLTLVALEYAAEMEQAVRQVFGKKLLARDLDTAAHFSKEYQLDAITTEGDQVNRKGGFEGGYHDERVSRIGAVLKIREATAKIGVLDKEEDVLKGRSEAADAAVNESMRELQRLETERDHSRGNAGQNLKELALRAKHVAAAEIALEGRREEVVLLSREALLARQQVTEYQQEQKSALKDKLSEKERQELRELSTREKALQVELGALERSLMGVTEERDKLRADLKSNLLKRREELLSGLVMGGDAAEDGAKGVEDLEGEMQIKRVEREHIVSQVAAATAELSSVEAQLDAKRLEAGRLDKQAEQGRVEEQAAQMEMDEAAKSQDRMLNKRTMLMETLSQKQHMIRELGTLPRKELEVRQCVTYTSRLLRRILIDLSISSLDSPEGFQVIRREAGFEAPEGGQREPEKVRRREQESTRPVRELQRAEGKSCGAQGGADQRYRGHRAACADSGLPEGMMPPLQQS